MNAKICPTKVYYGQSKGIPHACGCSCRYHTSWLVGLSISLAILKSEQRGTVTTNLWINNIPDGTG